MFTADLKMWFIIRRLTQPVCGHFANHFRERKLSVAAAKKRLGRDVGFSGHAKTSNLLCLLMNLSHLGYMVGR